MCQFLIKVKQMYIPSDPSVLQLGVYSKEMKTCLLKGTWVAQLVKYLTLDFHSGHDLIVHEIEPHLGSVLTVCSLLGILSLCPSPARAHSLALSLKINFLKNLNRLSQNLVRKHSLGCLGGSVG